MSLVRAGAIVLTLWIGWAVGETSQDFATSGEPAMPKGTATISGVVLTGTGEPAIGASVSLEWQPEVSPGFDQQTYGASKVVADDRGRFTFRDVPQHAVELSASLEGWLKVVFGQVRPGGVVPYAHVNAFRLQPLFDAEFLSGPDWGHATADEKGDYRVSNLTPGQYIVTAYRVTGLAPVNEIAPGRFACESSAFYLHAIDEDTADRIDLGLNDVRSGIDLQLRLTPVTTISGVVETQTGSQRLQRACG